MQTQPSQSRPGKLPQNLRKPAEMSGAQWLLQALEDAGVDTVFGYPGGAIMPVYDALVDSPIRHILTRHEQGAALAADGYARAGGRLGVCMATSGPGATNLLTGIANAHMDSIPLLAITGQVACGLMGTDAFQEVDVFGMSMPVVKHSWVVRDAADVYRIVREACRVATEGRPGPVLVDLPKDVASATSTACPWQPSQKRVEPICSQNLAAAHELIENSQKPVLYIGGGAVLANAEDALRRFAAASGIPAVATLKGLGALNTDHPAFLGMLGMHGNAAANHAVQNSDLLIVAGARFDDRATGRLDRFAPAARVIHMDTDSAEIGKLRPADVALDGDLSSLLDGLSTARGRWHSWQTHCARLKQQFQPRYDAPGSGIYAPALLRQLSIQAGDQAFVSCDVGQHQMWVAQHWRMTSGRQHLTSAGLGTMGYGLPAALGAWLARPERPVICVSGDGSIMMNIQELATLRRYGIPVKIVLLDNSALGLVRQWQELFHAERYSEVDLSDNPDFTEVSQAFGIEAFSVSQRSETDAALDRLLATKGPALLHVKIDPRANVWPLVPPGHDNASMLGERS